MKFGRVKAIFGVIAVSAVTTYIALSKVAKRRDILVSLVEDGSHVPDSDILVFNGVAPFLDAVQHLNSDMVAVVCAGPLQVISLPNLRPLDFTKSLSYEFNLHTPNYAEVFKVLRARSGKSVPVKSLTVDHLAMVIENTAEGGILLTAMNSLFSMCNMTARNHIRSKLVNLVLGKSTHKELVKAVEDVSDPHIKDRADTFIKKVKTKEFTTLVKALRDILDDKVSVNKAVKSHDFDSFEVSYLLKLIREVRRVENKYVS